jgi:hypothetical protein
VERIVVFGAASAALVLLAGCGGSGSRHAASPQRADVRSSPASPKRHPIAPAARCRAGTEESLGTLRRSYAAVVRSRAVVYRDPGRGPLATFGHLNVNGAWTVFGVLGAVVRSDCSTAWYRVQLPIPPNGATGYVRPRAVELSVVPTRIVVDLSSRRLTLYRNDRPVMRVVAGVGAPSTPTPTGRFYVNQRLIPADPSGPWGPGAIGISAHSSVLQYSWIQGAPIAIHGTDEPGSVGQAASHGCIRLENAVLRRLFAITPAGTPVIIRA